jgi:hypothetical protein
MFLSKTNGLESRRLKTYDAFDAQPDGEHSKGKLDLYVQKSSDAAFFWALVAQW